MPRSLNPEIREFLLRTVESCPHGLAPLAARRFGVTRATVSNYLNRLVREGVIRSQGRTKGRRYSLTPLAEVRGMAAIGPDMEDDAYWRRDLKARLADMDERVIAACQYGFTAAVSNAIAHSGGRVLSWRLRRDARRIEIAVFDDGEGALESLRRAGGLFDVRHAALELAKGGMTREPARHAGLGLYYAARLFDRFSLTSNGLSFRREMSADGDVRLRLERVGESEGTAALMDLELDRVRALGEVLAEWGAPPRRTELPLAFAREAEGPLVSRSQARRLTAGLERFEAVTLDFDGVEEIGPDFADELFRVFAAEHPLLALEPVHMSPAVERASSQHLGSGSQQFSRPARIAGSHSLA